MCALASPEAPEHCLLPAVSRKVPEPAQSFYVLSTAEKGFGYNGVFFYRLIPGFMCQGGDVTCHNSNGAKSIYGEKLDNISPWRM